MTARNSLRWGMLMVLWAITAWLLYPLVVLDSIQMNNAKEYLYRSAVGIAILIIILGKTIFDLLFPQSVNRKVPIVNTIFLSLYALVTAGGIIFLVSRMIILYMKSRTGDGGGFIF